MNVSLRKFPFPYKAMLAISSDIDSTNISSFRYIHEFFKNSELRLNFSDSIWVTALDSSRDRQLAFIESRTNKLTPYWKELKYYLNKGWIDSLHTYGNFSDSENLKDGFSRDIAENCRDFLVKNGIKFDVWINHGDEGNVQNVGKFSYMLGDTPGSYAYHSDLFNDLGIKYIWDPKNRTKFGHDSMLNEWVLNDGQKIWAFNRYHAISVNESNESYLIKRKCKFWGKGEHKEGVLWQPDLLDLQLSKENLDSLVESQQFSIVTQHLGNIKHTGGVFSSKAQEALKRLSDYSKEKIRVVSTSTLLNYNRARDYLKYSVADLNGITVIDILSIDDPVLGVEEAPSLEQLSGITFYCLNAKSTFISVNGTLVQPGRIARNPSDGLSESIAIKSLHENLPSDLVQRYKVINGQKESNLNKIKAKSDKALTQKASKHLFQRALDKALLKNKKSKGAKGDLPTLICIGGMKCGTSTLWDMLNQNPQVFGCTVKEPTYFGVIDSNRVSLDEYKSLWPWDSFNKRKHKILFEASTHYAKYPSSIRSAEQISKVLPNAKIIYLVRDPVKRMESQLAHHISRGELDLKVYQEGGWKNNDHLFNLSKYNLQISSYLKHFSKQNILVISLEELINCTGQTLKKVEDFSGILNYSDYSKLAKSNPRRLENGADSVKFDSDDIAFIKSKIENDIEMFKQNFSFNSSFWS